MAATRSDDDVDVEGDEDEDDAVVDSIVERMRARVAQLLETAPAPVASPPLPPVAGAGSAASSADLLAQARTALQANQAYQRALHRQLAQITEAQRANMDVQKLIRLVVTSQQTLPRRTAGAARRAHGPPYFVDHHNGRPPPNVDSQQWEEGILKRSPWTEWARPCTCAVSLPGTVCGTDG
jgi:hypothetical protein